MSSNPILWHPPSPETTQIMTFLRFAEAKTGQKFADYASLHTWSVTDRTTFWDMVWDFCSVIGNKNSDGTAGSILSNGDTFHNLEGKPRARFFPNARLNYAENLLRRRDDAISVVFRAEDKITERQLTFKQLYNSVSQMQKTLIELGVTEGDRVAGYLPNMPEALIAMLATTSLGAVWSSASPDFGVQGVVDRFGQIAPKVFIAVDSYFYNGKVVDVLAKLREVQPLLPTVTNTILVPFARAEIGETVATTGLKNTRLWPDVMAEYTPKEITFNRVGFDHPLFIMFSSGTTGAPKCIVHGHGGTLLQHLKEYRLQCDINEGQNVFYFTTTGWMMWNWLVSALGVGASIMLYDGSPFAPDGNVLFDYADAHQFTLFGTSAKYIDALRKGGLYPKDTHSLQSIRILTSTGSPLVHESFDYIYQHIKPDIHVASISGGTDIIASFMIGNPISPVRRGELQGAGLGFDLDAFVDDGTDTEGIIKAGELVCKKPFPSMPIYFLNDTDGSRYFNAYFADYPNIWRHGDWVEHRPEGGWIVYGRSDATLNPGGVRIGTAEIYRQVEKITEVKESIAIGQNWDDDVRVILFVVMKDGASLTDDLQKNIRKTIREGASPRHVPAVILSVPDIPRTKSGKITELAVRDIVQGKVIKNLEALANPECLESYRNRSELA